MPIKNSSSSVVLDVNAGELATEPETHALRADQDDPFRILVMGDFSGRANRGLNQSLDGRKPVRVDRDNFDDVLKRMQVQLALQLGKTTTVTLRFSELSDFEPDAIFKRCDLFRADAPPAPIARAAAPARAASVEATVERLTSGSLLDDILDQAETPVADARPRKSELQSVIDSVVAPHLVPNEDEATLAARVNTTQNHTTLMRAILHHPAFQALEAAWRALNMVVSDLDSDGPLSIHLLDVSKAELADRDGLDRILVQETVGTPGGLPWAVIAGNFFFDRTPEDVARLAILSGLARRAGAPFVAESIAPDADAAEPEWRALRASPDAHYLGLALPRFIARMPYGEQTYAVESFPFEEISGPPAHTDYLWANPAFAIALLLGRSFNDYGWNFRAGVSRQIEGLPFHSAEVDGEMRAQPCAEVLLTDHEIDFIHDQGCMALASIKNRDSVRLMRFQSVAEPLAGLAGRWI